MHNKLIEYDRKERMQYNTMQHRITEIQNRKIAHVTVQHFTTTHLQQREILKSYLCKRDV